MDDVVEAHIKATLQTTLKNEPCNGKSPTPAFSTISGLIVLPRGCYTILILFICLMTTEGLGACSDVNVLIACQEAAARETNHLSLYAPQGGKAFPWGVYISR